MNIIGVDIGLKMGVCHIDVDENEERVKLLTYWNYNTTRAKGVKNAPGLRYYLFRTQLTEYLRNNYVDMIFYEDVRRHAGTIAAHVYGGFKASLMDAACQLDIPVQGLGVGTIKKFATGKGNASKDAMMEACRALGHTPQNDNVADAFFIAKLGVSQL